MRDAGSAEAGDAGFAFERSQGSGGSFITSRSAGPSTHGSGTSGTPGTSVGQGGLVARARRTTDAAVEHLLSLQDTDGFWCAELEGDSILQSEYILLKWMLSHENEPDSRHNLSRIAAYLRRQQQPDGAWIQFPGGPIDLSATVKGYFALKLMGDDPEAKHMRKARELVLSRGGAERCNSFTKFYLAALGQIPWRAQPTIPPEIVLLPKWCYFHIDKLSAWTRTMILPLALVTTYRPCRQLTSDQSIDELYLDPRRRRRLIPTQDRPHPFWSRFFLGVDRALKVGHHLGITPWRKRSIQWIERWLVEHLQDSDGLGAIYPPMVYIQVALRCLGYSDDHPLLVKARKDLDDLMIHDAETDEIRIQPCFSPVWDTGIAAYALAEAGLNHEHEAMRRCADWLVRKECRQPADWRNNIPNRQGHLSDSEPSGWYFEYNNRWYPDVDDTAMVAMALHRIGTEPGRAAAQRGIDWIFAMQNDDGGWAAFDRDAHNRPILDQVPFADHNAMQDPSCPDITGRVLECLSWYGYTTAHPAVQKAIAFIRSRQEPDGAWFGRWGVNYIYGTWQVVCGLRRIGVDMNEPWVQQAGQWLREHQQPDGSFGESANSYDDDSLRGSGPPTASQTAWGAMALLAVFGPDDPAVQKGIDWLCQTQLDTGTWDEPWFTGTGFPRVFYLRYHLYRLYFPIMCLGRWLREHGELAPTHG